MRSADANGRAMPAEILSFNHRQPRQKAALRESQVCVRDATDRMKRRIAPSVSALCKVRRHIRFMLLFCGAAFAAGAYLQAASFVQTSAGYRSMPGRAGLPDGTPARAISVHDGDTIRVGEERIRLTGFDTPELGRNARCASEARDAARARDALRTAIDGGRDIRIERDGFDRYGRTLARLYIDGTDASALMTGAGLGRPYSGGRRDGWC